MQKLNRLTLALIVGLGAGGIPTQAQDAGAASATQVFSGAPANPDVLMEALRKKQAELSAAGISPNVTPAKASALEKKALAKKQKAEQEALHAQKSARSAEEVAEKIRAGEASKKNLSAPKEAKPAAAQSTKLSEPQSLDQLSISVNAPSVATKEQMDQVMQALRNKQAELTAQEAAAKQTKGAANVAPAAPEKTVKEVIVTPAQTPATKEQVDQMMQALRNKQAELAAQEAAAKAQAKASEQPAPEKVVKSAAPASEPRKELTKEEKLALKRKAAMDKAVAREQKRKAKMAAEAKKVVQQAPAKPEVKPAVAEKAKTPAKPAVVPASAVKPAQAVAPAPVMSKEQRLADLLRRYKADQLTPREYQAERAKVIAQP